MDKAVTGWSGGGTARKNNTPGLHTKAMPLPLSTCVFTMSMLGLGATGAVYLLDVTESSIAVKIARDDRDAEADHRLEQERFDVLAKRATIPYLIQCVYHTPQYTFLEYMPNSSLAMLLNTYQRRETVARGGRVLEVFQLPTTEQRHRWMWQLCCAAAGLADAGFAHGDIRPGNILFDADWNARLCDLDRCVDVGQDLVVASAPFGRLLNSGESVDEAGSFGRAGARTETFAIGSVLYSLLNGHEPYEMEDWGDDHGVVMNDRLQNKHFPLLGDSAEERIVRRCWHGEYTSVHELWTEFPPPTNNPTWTSLSSQQLERYRELCDTVVQSGEIGRLHRY